MPRPALQVTWIRDNKTDGEARYRVQVFGKDARTFDIRISLKAKYQAKSLHPKKRSKNGSNSILWQGPEYR
jgi:hypothetical protein